MTNKMKRTKISTKNSPSKKPPANELIRITSFTLESIRYEGDPKEYRLLSFIESKIDVYDDGKVYSLLAIPSCSFHNREYTNDF
jgi:hypothetical protein